MRPRASGKTLAVWLEPVVEAMNAGEAPAGCRMIWLTLLRALAQDTARSLTEPLRELGSGLEVAVLTGDTSSHRKAKLRERLPFALVTTPESLSLMLTYEDSSSKLGQLTCVVVDEWHELLGTKRGVQTELCLTRLRHWAPNLRVWEFPPRWEISRKPPKCWEVLQQRKCVPSIQRSRARSRSAP